MKRIRDFDVASLFARVTAFSVRRALVTVAGVTALALIGLLLALRLDPGASTPTLSDRDTRGSKATDELHRNFGDEPIVVLVRGKLTGMLLTRDVGQLLGLEGCISGNAPRGAKPPAPVCAEFAKLKPIQVVYGPGTFINDAAARILDQLGLDQRSRALQAQKAADAARRAAKRRGLGPAEQRRAAQSAIDAVQKGFAQDALRLSLQYGLNSVPALNNPEFVLQLVFAPAIGAEVPKPRFSYVFPDSRAALIQARLRPGLSDSEQRHAIAMVREAVGSGAFRLKYGSYVVAGAPVVADGVASSLPGAAWALLAVSALAVAAVLAAALRARRWLLGLVLALATTAIAFGLASLVGASLTIAAVAALPVLVGLATGFALQLADRGDPRVIAAGGLTAVAGSLVLVLSPVPMVRSFGALVALGIVLAFAVALTAGAAVLGASPGVSVQLRELARRALARLPRLSRRGLSPQSVSRLRALAVRHFASPPAGRASRFHFVERARLLPARAGLFASKGWDRALDASIRRPRRVVWIAFGVALVGWVAADRLDVVSDLERLAPSGNRAVADQAALRDATGSAGQVSVLIHGADLADPRAIAWMSDYQRRVLAHHGYSDRRPCREAQLCPGLSVTNLFTSGPPRTRRQAETVFRSLPRYFAENVITKDRRTANMAFVIGRMSLGDQQRVIDDMRGLLNPPAGVTAKLAGLPVLAAERHSSLEQSRWTLALAALLAVFGVLLVAYGTIEAALVPLTPVALAGFWGAPVLWLMQVSLNPLSVALWALVIAVTAQFSVAFSALYTQERASQTDRRAALDSTYRRARPALLISAAVALAGFATLIVSGFPMLHDFGIAMLVELTIAMLGMMLVMPAVLVTAEEGARLPRTRAEAAAAARSLGVRTRLGFEAAARAFRQAPAHFRGARRRLRASAPFKK